jgi:hypothetical protein
MRNSRIRLSALRTLALASLTLAIVALSGCKGTTPIKSLLDDPARFAGQTVRIAGTVESSVGVLTVGAYKLNDGTGTITVVTKTSGVPREGAKVGVEGQVKSGFTLGSESLTVFVESRRTGA